MWWPRVVRVFTDIGACSLMVGATAVVGSLVAGARVWLRTMLLSPGSLVLLPLIWTVIQHGCWVRLLIGSLTLCGWGSIPLLSAGVHSPVCWGFPRLCSGGRSVDFSLFLVSAMFGRFSASLGWARPVWGVSGWFPFTYGWAVTSALRAAREHAPLGVWLPGVVALVAYAVSGCPVTVPVGYGCGVSLFLAGRFAARIVPCGCLFVGCGLQCRVLPVCCGFGRLSAIVVVRDS